MARTTLSADTWKSLGSDEELWTAFLSSVQRGDIDDILSGLVGELREEFKDFNFSSTLIDVMNAKLSEAPTEAYVRRKFGAALADEYREALESLEANNPDIEVDQEQSAQPSRSRVNALIRWIRLASDPEALEEYFRSRPFRPPKAPEASGSKLRRRPAAFLPNAADVHVRCEDRRPKLVETVGSPKNASLKLVYAVGRNATKHLLSTNKRIAEALDRCRAKLQATLVKIPRIQPDIVRDPNIWEHCVSTTLDALKPIYQNMLVRNYWSRRPKPNEELVEVLRKRLKTELAKCVRTEACSTGECRSATEAQKFAQKLRRFATADIEKAFDLKAGRKRQQIISDLQKKFKVGGKQFESILKSMGKPSSRQGTEGGRSTKKSRRAEEARARVEQRIAELDAQMRRVQNLSPEDVAEFTRQHRERQERLRVEEEKQGSPAKLLRLVSPDSKQAREYERRATPRAEWLESPRMEAVQPFSARGMKQQHAEALFRKKSSKTSKSSNDPKPSMTTTGQKSESARSTSTQ